VADSNISGFALDCNVSDGNTINDVCDFHVGESNSSGLGHGIFPGSIDINDITGAVDSYGNPVAPNDDPCALGGIGTDGVTIELGALYEDGNQPPRTGTLCTLVVSSACNITIAENARRGGVVKEDSNSATTNLPITVPVPCVSLCTVPNIIGMNSTDANAAIIAAGLSVGAIDWSTSSVIDVNLVTDQDPNGGEQVSCNPTAVNYNKSAGCYPKCKADYSYWRSINQGNFKTHCFCNPRQCHGDGMNDKGGTKKAGYYYVGVSDLSLLAAGWLVKEPAAGPGISTITYNGVPGICGDFAHDKKGTKKAGYYYVGVSDLTEMAVYWLVKEPAVGPGTPADCLNCP
jgi:hypothetical protein